MKLLIKKTGINGEGIGYLNRKPVFVDGTMPGDVADVTIKETAGSYYRGELRRILQKSPDRCFPFCPHQRECGGCSLMTMKYHRQLETKKQLLKEALNKYCSGDIKVSDCVSSPLQKGYRNKINLPVISKNGKLYNAMFRTGSNHPILIDTCPMHDPQLEQLRHQVLNILSSSGIGSYDNSSKSGYRQLVMRMLDSNCQVVLVTGNDTISESTVQKIMHLKGVVSLHQGINTSRNPLHMMPEKLKLLAGQETLTFGLGDLQLQIEPQAFFQLNKLQAEALYRHAASTVSDSAELIVEAFSGIGAISLMLHDRADKVMGIDNEPAAVASAYRNSVLNEIDNAEYICDDASDALISLYGSRKPDVLIADPPRTGLDDRFINTLMNQPVRLLIYISCNPATLARNLKVLTEKYDICEITPYDMFPQTPNVESITVLTLKKGG